MIIVRIKSFIVCIVKKKNKTKEKVSIQNVLCNALTYAEVYRNTKTDVIMIYSKSAFLDEVSSFLTKYRSNDSVTPLVVEMI